MRAETLVIAVILGVAVGCRPSPTASPPPQADHTVAAAELAPVEVRVPFVGTVEAARQVSLVALAPGRIVALEVSDGGEVVSGQVVLRVGGDRFNAAVAAASGAASAAREVVAARRDQLARAERRASNHLADPTEVADARSALAEAERNRAQADAQLELMSASAVVRAPFEGRLTARRVTVGQEVSAGTILADVVDPKSARILATVVGASDHAVQADQSAQLTNATDGTNDIRVAGLATAASNAGTSRVWLTGNGLAQLSTGIAVSGWIVTDRHDGVVIPMDAVVRDDQDHPYVFVGRAAPFDRRPVELGVEMGHRIEVVSGLAVGETVVTEGAYELLWSSFATSFTPQD